MKKILKGGTAIAALFAVVTPYTDAMAQEVVVEDSDSRSFDTVVVTAQRREQSLQDVPVSVTAISGEALQEAQITNITELVNIIPGLDFTRQQETRNAGFRIRGVGTQTFNEGVIGSVGTVVDGVVLGRQAQGLGDLIDVERIEVLRGPQGTLFGASTTAGLINVTTKAPSDELEVFVDAEYGSFNTWKLRGSISGPIAGDAVTARVTGYQTSTDGQGGVNLVTGEDVNTRDEMGIRAKFNFDVADNLNILLIADYTEIESNCCQPTIQGADASPLLGDFVPTDGNRDSIAGGTEFFENQEAWGLASVVDLEIGNHTLRSVTSYREWDFAAGGDIDLIPLNFLDFAGTQNFTEEFQQEFQLTSPDDQRFRYLAGLYFFDQDLDRLSRFTGAYGGALEGAELTEIQDITFGLQTWAVFGQANYDLTEQFEVFAGLRYTDMEMEVDHVRPAGTPVPLNLLLGFPLEFQEENSDENLSGTVGLIYKPVETVSFFATYTNGYKGIALNIEAGGITEENLDRVRVDPETVDSFELGVKTFLFDRRLNVNATLYHSTFTDFHSSSFDPDLSLFTLVNAGELVTQGFEIEAFALPTENLDINASVGYIDATFEEFAGGPCYAGQTVAEGCVDGVQDLSGARLNNAPEWFLATAAQYRKTLGSSGLEGFLRGDVSYRTEVFTDVNQDPASIQDAYTLVNASVGVATEDGRYRVAVFGKNITDVDYAFRRSQFGNTVGIPNGSSAFLANPAMYGVSVSGRF